MKKLQINEISIFIGKHRFSLLFLVFLIIVTALIILFIQQQNKFAYININEVYEEFDLKIELENKLLKSSQNKDNILLELESRISKMQNDPDVKESAQKQEIFYDLQRQYYNQKKQFDEENESLVNEYNEQIWSRLNLYIKQFGKQSSYDFILGATGEGNIMFANEKKDITNQLKIYVNKKYKGEL